MTCGADTLATTLITELTADVPYTIPNASLTGSEFSVPAASQLTQAITKLNLSDLASGEAFGTGSFDKLMGSLSNYLMNEYKSNRITGAEYTKTFIALTELAMAQGTSFLVQTDKQYWENMLVQQQAELVEVQVVTAKIKQETAKVEYAVTQIQARTLEAEYATKKMQLALLSSQFCTSEYELSTIAPRKLAMMNEQILLVTEQKEAARAQTLSTRTDGTTIVGTLGAQRKLHEQQVSSYIQDTKIKVSKMYSDLWVTYITINDGLLADASMPPELKQSEIGEVMSSLRTGVGL